MSTTPNYGLYLPGQGEEAWDDKMNGNLTTIDATLQALADIVEGAVYQINNVTYVAANSRWNGSTWNRVNTGAPAVRLALNSTTGTMEVATAAAGTNPITWTTVQTFSATGLDMKSKKIANLATPTAATDAATKAYIDGLIAALKLSQIAIDTNKDWGGRTISNVVLDGSLKSTLVIARASDTLRASSDASKYFERETTKSKEIQLSSRLYGLENTFRVKYDLASYYEDYVSHAQIYVNDSPRGAPHSKVGGGYITISEDITGLKAGDKIQLYTGLNQDQGGSVAKFRIYADYDGVLAPVAPSHTVIL